MSSYGRNYFTGTELDQLAGNFRVDENYGTDGKLISLASPIERIQVGVADDQGKKTIYRNSEVAVVSDRYEVVPSSKILQGIFNSTYWADIRSKVESLVVLPNGTLELKFNRSHSMRPVLDITNTSGEYRQGYKGYELKTKEYGEFFPQVFVKNSYNKAVAASILAGLWRQVCGNGAVAIVSGIHSDRVLHMDYNREILESSIRGLIENLPRYVGEATIINDMSNVEFTADVKEAFIVDYAEWKREKIETKTVKGNYYNKNDFSKFDAIIPEAVEKAGTLLDFENVLSFFKNTRRFNTFNQNLAVQVENIFKKVNNVKVD